MQPVRVLVVDDSVLMRQLISKMLNRYPIIQVVGTAVNGSDALNKIKILNPDVVTLDIEMPIMDGLTALKEIIAGASLPVIMFSTHTSEGTKSTIEALTLGAFDFVTKPSRPSELEQMVAELARKIEAAARVLLNRIIQRPAATGAAFSLADADTRLGGRKSLVVMGSSTGGPGALHRVVPSLPEDFPAAVVIVQHIPAGFSKPLADHLARKSRLPVRHAESGDQVTPGEVLVAPAGYDLIFTGKARNATVILDKGSGPPPPGGFRPSVDRVMKSAAGVFGEEVLGVLMTGMGRDGAQGMKEIKEKNGSTIAEAESTCVVFGMPRAAIELGAADRVVPLHQIVSEIIAML